MYKTGAFNAKTVKACSPNRQHYSDFIKHGEAVYVEAWNEEELKEAYPYLHADVQLDVMVKRFRRVGGNLRVLLKSEAYYKSSYDSKRVKQRTSI